MPKKILNGIVVSNKPNKTITVVVERKYQHPVLKKVMKAKKKYNITNDKKNIVCGVSASGPTKRWNINNYIRLFEELNKKYKINFFLAGGSKDEELIKTVEVVEEQEEFPQINLN